MTVSDILERTWEVIGDEAAAIDGCYHRRIPILSEWPVHAGICRPTNLRTLILETDTKSARSQQLPEATNGYSIEVAESQSADGARTHIRIHETNLRFREVFTIFSADIVEHWVPHAQASDSLRSLKRRLSHWRAFFQRGAHLGLSREDYVGLYGELSFIEEGLAAGIESLQMVTAWQAPLATNQDFLFGALAAEIKTTTGNDIEKIRINNARQLDSSTLDCLCLTSYAFDFRRGNGRTLHQLVSTLKESLASTSSEASDIFEGRLLDAGFADGVRSDYDEWGFSFRRVATFRVGDGFPRLLESDFPPGVSDVTYTLNLSAAVPFKLSQRELWNLVISSYA